jgi:hypothetical protein
MLDHCFQSITSTTDAHIPDIDMRLHHEFEGFLRWRPERAADYVTYREQDTLARQRLYRVIERRYCASMVQIQILAL